MDLLSLFSDGDDAAAFPAGATIFHEGTPAKVMYVILEGEVEMFVRGESVEVAVAGDLFGEMAIIDDSWRSASAVALTDCRLAVIDEPLFHSLVERMPAFSLHVMQVLAQRVRTMDDRLRSERG